MAIYKQPEADAMDVPANPTAQNAATEALKPKAKAVPSVGASMDDPNAPALPGVQASSAAPAVNMDPNAYAPPPQATEAATAVAQPLPTLSGDWQAPTASANSAPLIASAAGGTMTPQGDASNPFKGYETDQGGKFGGYDSVPLVNDAAGRTFKTYDQDFVKNANALKQVPPLSNAEFQAMTATDSGANAVKDKIANGLPVSDKELAFVRQARGMELGQNTAAPTFGTFGTKTGTTTAANPAEQEALLAGQAAGTVPSGPAAPVAATPALPTAAPSGAPTEAAIPAANGVITTQTGGQNTGATPTLPTVGPSGQPATASGMGNVAQTATTADNALTNSTLSRAEGADRYKIAQDQWDAFTKSTAPQYEADQRSAMRRAAAGGALGSGMLQTSLGDLANNRALQLDTSKTNFLSEALKGNIDDQFKDVGVAERQQAFQKTQQEQAFGNAKDTAKLEEDLTSGEFERSLKKLIAGSGGNPADTALLLSQIFGGQASEAGSSLAQLLSGMGQKSTAGGTSSGGGDNHLLSTIMDYIKKMGGGTTTATPDDHMTP